MSNTTQVATTENKPSFDIGAMWKSITDMASDPNVDPVKMQTLVELQERMMDRHAKAEFQAAMFKARQKMPRITKDGAITNRQGQVQSRYSTYEAIDKICKPLVEAEGLTYGFNITEGEQGRLLVTCIVSHIGGHEERFGPMPLAIDTTGSKNPTQGAGSSSNYGKRYTLCAAFNIVTEGQDDDGNQGRVEESQTTDNLIEQSQMAATGGLDAYAKFFSSLTNAQRSRLVDSGEHANNKAAAAAHDG